MTPRGWAAAATAVVTTAVGVVLHWPAVLALGVALSVVVLAAVVHLVRPPDLHVDRRLSPARVRKGELAIAHLRLRNRARRTFTGAVGIQRVGDVEVEVALPRLRRGDEDVRTSVLPSGQRGRHEVAPLVLRRADPFDLVRAEQRHGRADELLVLPRVLPFRALHDTRRRSLEGVADDTTPNGTMTFHQMREYVPGDDVRRIHWPSTARVAHTGTLVVRQDVDDAQPFVVVLADTRPEAYPDLDTRELAIDAAASAVVAVAHGHAPFELRTTTGERLGGPTETPTEPALEALALTGDEVRSTLTGELSLVQRGRGGAAAVVVTGDPDAAELGAVTALRSRFARVLLVSVTDGPRPRAVHRGLTMVQGHDAASLTTAWDLAVRG